MKNIMKNINQQAISKIKQSWDEFSKGYTSFDSGPQTFYFSLVNLLGLDKASHILEIGCGGGLLIPYALEKKKPEATYVATDLSSEMIEIAEKRLRFNFDRYQSKISYQQWVQNNRLTLKAANGQNQSEFQGYPKFDLIICNLVLMLTDQPKNILRSVYNLSTEDARMGVTIWGDRQKNNLVTIFGKARKNLNIPTEAIRSPFYLAPIIQDIFNECGWQVELKWDQFAAFPFLEESKIQVFINDKRYTKDIEDAQTRQKLTEEARRLLYEIVKVQKKALGMHAIQYIIKKK